jgi:hypothetical protein
MIRIRQVGLAVLAVAAIAIFFALEPAEAEPPPIIPAFAPEASDYVDLVEGALADFESNDTRADTAPKQQVVNGWVTRDLLAIIALQGAQSITAQDVMARQNELLYAAATTSEQRDDRPAALLVIGVLAIVLWGITSVTPKPEALPLPLPTPPDATTTPRPEPKTERDADSDIKDTPESNSDADG